MNRPTRVRMLAAASIVALLSVPVTAGAGASKAAQKRNPFGITIVRFAKGTTSAQMRDAVAKAGGDVVTDLSRINAVAAAPLAGDFATRIKADARVTAAFQDSVLADVAGPDLDPTDTAPTASPALGSPGATTPPDPWHDAPTIFGTTNPEGIVQWDDNRMAVPAAWAKTTGDRSVRVAVVDSGVQGSHKELLANYDNKSSTNEIPCNTLTKDFGAQTVHDLGLRDCSSEDTEGHGTWVASRIAGAANGFASNGVAPNVQVMSFKVLATGFGGLTSWVVAGMLDACDSGANLLNVSTGGYDNPLDPTNEFAALDAQDYLVWVDAVSYCRSKGVAIFSAAGNEHVRVNRTDNVNVGGRILNGVGRVDTGAEGVGTVTPGDQIQKSVNDFRGMLEIPAGVPGVIMVSATGNAIGAAPASVPLRWTDHVGARDQLAYYSSYGSRVDLAAPGGARKFAIPRFDGGDGDILYDGWGDFGALDPSGEICTTPLGAMLSFACFKVSGAGFGFLQGTSMAAPNATGVAALVLSARHELQGNPDALLARLRSTARMTTNYMGPNDPSSHAASLAGVPCATGWCHVDQQHAIPSPDAYGAGIVNAAASVG